MKVERKTKGMWITNFKTSEKKQKKGQEEAAVKVGLENDLKLLDKGYSKTQHGQSQRAL